MNNLKLKLKYKKPLLININTKNYSFVNKIYTYYLHYQNTIFNFETKKALKAFILDQYKKGYLYKDCIENLKIDCVVSKNWTIKPITSYINNHFNIEYY